MINSFYHRALLMKIRHAFNIVTFFFCSYNSLHYSSYKQSLTHQPLLFFSLLRLPKKSFKNTNCYVTEKLQSPLSRRLSSDVKKKAQTITKCYMLTEKNTFLFFTLESVECLHNTRPCCYRNKKEHIAINL